MVGGRPIRLSFLRHRRARRYILRLTRDGSARVTLPQRGSLAEARRFAAKNLGWLEKQMALRAARTHHPKPWIAGTLILFRGEQVALKTAFNDSQHWVEWSNEVCPIDNPGADLRPAVEDHLWRVAASELPARTLQLAALHGFNVRRVTVRNQRSRWGSCSPRGTISLNWRLVQTPPSVRDYIILHELAHLKFMNHSRRFWREVARLCPEFAGAEQWLKKNSRRLF